MSMAATGCLRACANRSWLSGGSALPTVTNPAFPDKPSHHDDHVGEGDPEVYDPTLPLGTPHKLLMGVVPRVRPLHDPAQAGCERSGRAFFGDHAHEPTLLQKSAGLSRVVGPIKVDAGVFRQLHRRLALGGVEGRRKNRRVMAVGFPSDPPPRGVSPAHPPPGAGVPPS